MRYIFFLLLQLYIPARASIPTQPSRYKKKNRSSGVRGRKVRRLVPTANIFNQNRNTDDTLVGGELGQTTLAFDARATMLKAKLTTTKGGTRGEPNQGLLDLPRKTTMIMRKGMGQTTTGTEAPTFMDDGLLEFEGKSSLSLESTTTSSSSSKSPYTTSASSSSKSQYTTISKTKGSTPSLKSKLSKKPKLSKSGKGSMNMDVHPPTLAPTHAPTFRPTLTLTPTPTQMPVEEPPDPTMAPTDSPTEALTEMPCMVDAAGNVGSMKGDVTLYDFFYQLEVTPGMTAEDVDLNLLGDIEIAMANELIPVLFPEQCGDGRKLQVDMTTTVEGRYIGLSTRPPDFVLSGCKFLPHVGTTFGMG
jgi:hypothetical protein